VEVGGSPHRLFIGIDEGGRPYIVADWGNKETEKGQTMGEEEEVMVRLSGMLRLITRSRRWEKTQGGGFISVVDNKR